jgi:hypothetical protein
VTDVAADATTSVDSAYQTVATEPLDLNEQDVTAPVAGTEGPRPLDEVKTLTDVRVGNPDNPQVAFPLQGPFAERPTTAAAAAQPVPVVGTVQQSEGRTIASLRLARLRIQAGIAEGDDDLSLGTSIASGEMTDESIQNEIDTLAKVVTTAARRPQPVSRSLVPRTATAGVARTVPSMAPAEPAIPIQTVAAGVDDSEFLFE